MLRPSAAVLALAVAGLLAACVHVPTEKERQGAEAHYDLGVSAQTAGDVRSALKEFEASLKLDEDFAEAHNAIALLLHLSFDKKDEAEKHYRRALEIRPTFSEAKVNLGNLYLDQGRLDEAISAVRAGAERHALRDAVHRRGQPRLGVLQEGQQHPGHRAPQGLGDHQSPVLPRLQEPRAWCRTLAGDLPAACTEFGRFVDACPKVAEAYQLQGSCQVRQGRAAEARASFDACVENGHRRGAGAGARRVHPAARPAGRAGRPALSRRRVERWEDEALVLGTLDYGEADRLVTLLTRGRGKLTAFAAGARKSRRRFAGALEPGTRAAGAPGGTARLHRPARRGGRGARLSPHPRGAAAHRPRALRARAAAASCSATTSRPPSSSRSTVDWLGRLDAGEAGPTSVLAFELQALALAGLMPRFDACALCGGPPGEAPRFDVDHGGAVCAGCGARSTGPGHRPGGARRPRGDPGRRASAAVPGAPGRGPRAPRAVHRGPARTAAEERRLPAQRGRRLVPRPGCIEHSEMAETEARPRTRGTSSGGVLVGTSSSAGPSLRVAARGLAIAALDTPRSRH